MIHKTFPRSEEVVQAVPLKEKKPTEERPC